MVDAEDPALRASEAPTGTMYALILSGGRGERLRPLTDAVPKPMVQVCGKPILQHQAEWLVSAGVTDIVFLAGYSWEAIRDHFQDGSAHGFRAHYSIEDTPLGRGGAIRKGMAQLPPSRGPVIVTNGDVVTSLQLPELLERYHQALARSADHLATITVVPFRSPYGIVDLNDSDLVTGFREKVELPYWINAGVYVLSREIETLFPELGDHETETFPSLAEQGKLSALPFRGDWCSIDSFKDLREAEEQLGRAYKG